jgi:hypothetical protein
MAVAEIMETDPRNASLSHEVDEFIRQAIGLLRLTILPCADQHLTALPNAQGQERLGLLPLPTA